jgi:UDP-4-amino-4,6-dideoxy-N-acetyl-beta-L-altrosamine transaminase
MSKTGKSFLPYGRQHISQEDIDAVVEVLQSDWLTQGPTIARFEEALADKVGARHAVACATGTAALHLSMLALGIGPGDKVVTTPNTFLADANCARYVGAEVLFADIDPETGNMAPDCLARVLEADRDRAVKAVIPVHFAGQPADLPQIHKLASEHGAVVIDDACHALGATYQPEAAVLRPGCGEHSTMTVYSFHPVKHVAMGEGGAVATNDDKLADRLRQFRNHGMTKTEFACAEQAHDSDGSVNPWYYEMPVLGYNYRLTDIQAALGLSQLDRLDWSVQRRNQLAFDYHRLIEQLLPSDRVRPMNAAGDIVHAYHLFVVRIDFEHFGVTRAAVMNQLREAGIGTQVHYIPVPLQPYYRELYGHKPGDFPGAETYYAQALSLPMYPDLTDSDCQRVIEALRDALGLCDAGTGGA